LCIFKPFSSFTWSTIWNYYFKKKWSLICGIKLSIPIGMVCFVEGVLAEAKKNKWWQPCLGLIF
jgi:hypothetical protein